MLFQKETLKLKNENQKSLFNTPIKEEPTPTLNALNNQEALNTISNSSLGHESQDDFSNLFEDVYTYNDFSYEGVKKSKGVEKKKKVTSNMSKAYFVSEYNGHMFPTKTFDCEEHRIEHALRHVQVMNDIAGEPDIAGGFGWCMFDYNTHKDFGSGDRICYHGVMDMFRNPKMASYVYATQQEDTPVLEISSTMDIGEHPGSNRGDIYIFTNADSVKMYKNDIFIKEYTDKDSEYKNQ